MKSVTRRQSQHNAERMLDSAKLGEGADGAKRGNTHGRQVSAAKLKRRVPDLLRQLSRAPYSQAEGHKFIEAALAEA